MSLGVDDRAGQRPRAGVAMTAGYARRLARNAALERAEQLRSELMLRPTIKAARRLVLVSWVLGLPNLWALCWLRAALRGEAINPRE